MTRFKFFTLHFIVFCCWALIVGRAFQLQVMPNERLEAKINGQFASKVVIRAKRGDIFDRNGKVLATSVSSWSAFVDPELVVQKDKLVDKVSQILGMKRSLLLKNWVAKIDLRGSREN